MIPMIHNYTSNITRKQFELIREDLENWYYIKKIDKSNRDILFVKQR